ncbi:substrate binding domain-containing protein [Massilia sp. IC2-476]|uniref:substrate binding domain-containing protein n=1 Tax=Massilia sp. IC2-476 TaxID=2887199 RepID=UPI001D10FBC3|nr:substrate binding domain-containing protein [Massilia sp. IC2-476]MCC2974611.1 substrate binding domain-containing protein [Massilia sp. IC2-476]
MAGSVDPIMAQDAVTARKYETARGQQAFEAWSELILRLDQVQQELAAPDGLAGQLALSIPSGCLSWLAPLLHRYRAAWPRVQLCLNIADGRSDLVRDRNDLALRFGQLKDSNLRALKLTDSPLVVCASPGYLAQAGTPRVPADLAEHEGVFFRRPDIGRPRPVELAPESASWQAGAIINDGQALVQAALAGFGLIQAPLLLVQREIDAGQLVEVLYAHRPAPMEVNLVFSGAPWLPAQTRAFVDMAKEMFRG